MNSPNVEIALNKTKIILMLLASLAFVAAGIWIATQPLITNIPIINNPTFKTIIGVASILFFGLASFILSKKLFDNKPGLIISPEGVTDNSTGVSIGFIPWSDIEDIETSDVVGQKFICIIPKNSEKYIDKATNVIQKKLMKANSNSYKSPINISANALKINFNDLQNLLVSKMKEYKT